MAHLKPATAAVLALLRDRPGGITSLDALDSVGSFRLGARIWELKAAGYAIESTLVTTETGKRVSRYRPNEAPVQLVAFG